MAIELAGYHDSSWKPERGGDVWQVNLHEVYLRRLRTQADIREGLEEIGSHLVNLEFDEIDPGNSLVSGIQRQVQSKDGVNIEGLLNEGHETRDLGLIVVSCRAVNNLEP